MLILERKIGDSIIIDGNIKITYLSGAKYGYKIRLGIEAPQSVVVDREEIHLRKMQEKTDANQ